MKQSIAKNDMTRNVKLNSHSGGLEMRYLSVAIGAMFALGVVSAAMAQTAPPIPKALAASTVIEEVIVTAEKKSASAMNTPVSLSVVDGESLKAAAVVSISNLQNLVPSLNVGRNVFGVNINIRGVTTTDNTSKGTQGILFNVDGIAIGRPIEQGLSFFDVERVEVLKGPQGTLYGGSSTGGAINVISNKPKGEFEASADMEIASFNAHRGNAMVNIPVNDVLALRAAVNFNKRDGYLIPKDGSPARNDQDDTTGRISALFNFSSNSSLLVTDAGGRVGGVGGSNVPLGTFLSSSGEAQRTVFGNPFGGKIKDSFNNLNGEFNWWNSAVHLTYVGAHLSYSAREQTSSTNDPAGNFAGPNGNNYTWRDYRGKFETDSHELRLSNQAKGNLDWVAGLNWLKEDIHESDHNWNAPVSNPTLAGSTNGIDPLNNTIHTSKGLFGQLNYHLNEKLNLTAGLRRSSDEVVRNGTFAAGPGPWKDPSGANCVAPADCVGNPNNGTQAANKMTYRLGVDYHFAANQMIYGNVSTGYKAGGFNDFDPRTNAPSPYLPEELTAYEVGYKGRLQDNLQFTSSVFYYDYKNLQISSAIVINGSNVILTSLIPAKINGWENELKYKPTPVDTISVASTIESSKYVSLLVGNAPQTSWAGLSLDKTPKFVMNLSYAHDWTVANGAGVRAFIGTKYSSSYILSNSNQALRYTQPSFTRTDANITYSTSNDKFSVTAFATNLEDKLQMISTPGNFSATIVNAGNVAVSEPRTFGIRMAVRF